MKKTKDMAAIYFNILFLLVTIFPSISATVNFNLNNHYLTVGDKGLASRLIKKLEEAVTTGVGRPTAAATLTTLTKYFKAGDDIFWDTHGKLSFLKNGLLGEISRLLSPGGILNGLAFLSGAGSFTLPQRKCQVPEMIVNCRKLCVPQVLDQQTPPSEIHALCDACKDLDFLEIYVLK